jgi:hypothetical protein
LQVLAVAQSEHVGEQRQQIISAHSRVKDAYHLLHLKDAMRKMS